MHAHRARLGGVPLTPLLRLDLLVFSAIVVPFPGDLPALHPPHPERPERRNLVAHLSSLREYRKVLGLVVVDALRALGFLGPLVLLVFRGVARTRG